MTGTKLRVLIADDHALVRDGLKRLIDEQPDMHVVAEAADGPEALRLCETLAPDVALVDVSMRAWDGVKTAQALRSACPQMNIVTVTRYDDESFVRRMLAAGVNGYVLKQSPSAHLINGIRAVARGEHYIDPTIRRAAEVAAVAPAPVPDRAATRTTATLTDTELQVLRLAAASHSSREIGEQLRLDATRVADVKASAMAKLGLQTRIQLLDYARRHHWLV